MTALVTTNLPLMAGAPDGMKKLRAFILELAVRGKLVPQDSSDEPSLEILNRAELALTGRDVKRKTKGLPPESEDADPPYEVPRGWAWSRLGNIAEVIRGVTYSKSDAHEQPGPNLIPLLRGNNISDGKLNFDGPVFVPSSLVSADQYIRAGDLVIAMSSGSADLVGKAAQAEQDFHGAFGAFCGVVRPAISDFFPYFGFFFQTPFYRSNAAGRGKGIGINNLQKTALQSMYVPIPPLAEQHRIVAKVDELMALCDRLEADQAEAEAAHAQLVQALLDSLTQATDAADFRASWQRLSEHFHTIFTTEASIDALKAAVLELGVTGRLVKGAQAERTTSVVDLVSLERRATLSSAKFIKHEELANAAYWDCPYDLPKDWSWVSLAALVMQITDGTHHTPTYVERGVPFISVKDLDGKTVSFEDCRQIPEAEHEAINTRCNPERGDLLLCRIGTLGRPTIVDTDRPFSLFVSVGLLKMPKRIDLSNFLHLVLSSPVGYRQYERIKAGGSHTNKLNLGDIPKIMIPVPPLEDQRGIIAKVNELMALCDQLNAHLAEFRQQHAQLSTALVEQAVA